MAFDPSKPYEVVDAPRFDPSKPFEAVNDEPAAADALKPSDFSYFSEIGDVPDKPDPSSGFFKSLVRGVNIGAGNIIKGVGQATSTPFQFPVADDATPSERAVIEAENARDLDAKRMAAAQRNPLVTAGKFISDTGEEIPAPTGILGKAGETAGNLASVVATGPYAPIAMAASKYGETLDKQYAELKKQGLTDEQSAEQATATAKRAGLTEGAIWAALPVPLRTILGKATGLVGEGAVQQFLARRVASSVENAALSAASQAGGNLATGQPVAQGTGQAALGGAALGVVVPFHAPERPGIDREVEAAAIAGGRPIVRTISGETAPPQPGSSSAESPSTDISQAPVAPSPEPIPQWKQDYDAMMRSDDPLRVRKAAQIAMKASEDAAQANLKAAGTGKIIRFQSTADPNRYQIVSQEPTDPSIWRLTRFDDRGPSGHDTFKTRENAVRYASGGQRVEGQPAWGAIGEFVVSESRGEDKPLNPGGALKDLPPELQAKSNSMKDAMAAEFAKLKAQAAKPTAIDFSNTPFYHGSFVGGIGDKAIQPSRYGDFGNGVYLTNDRAHASRFASGENFATDRKGSGEVHQVEFEHPKNTFTSDSTPLTREEIQFWEQSGEDMNGILTRKDLIDNYGGRNFSNQDQKDISEGWDSFLKHFGYDSVFTGDELIIKSGEVRPKKPIVDQTINKEVQTELVPENPPNKLVTELNQEAAYSPLSHVEDHVGKIRLKSQDDGIKDHYGEAYTALQKARPDLFSKSGSTIDQVVHNLNENGFPRVTEEDLFDTLLQAHKERQDVLQGRTPEGKMDKFQQALQKNTDKKSHEPVLASSLKQGETFSIGGEHFEVMGIDEDGTVHVKDGRKFGPQTILDGDTVPTDKGSYTKVEDTGFDPKQPFTLEPAESPDQQKAREEQESADAAVKKAENDKAVAKATAEREARAKLVGRIGGNLGDAGQGGLFAEPGQQEIFQPPAAERPFGGMGGAVPREFENSPQTPTGIKNATVERERALRGLPPAVQPARKSFGDVWDKAMARIDSDPSWLDGDSQHEGLIDELKRKPRALTDEEDAALLHRQIDLQNEYGKTTRELAKAHDSGQLEYAAGLRIRAAELRDKLFDLYEINKRAGTETGRGLNARKMMANEDFTLANMEVEARAANGGKPLDDTRLKEVQNFQKKISEADERIKKAEADAVQARAESELNRIKAEAAKGPQINPKVLDYAEKFVKGLEKRGDAALLRLREKLKQVGSAPDPTIILDLAEWGVGKLGRKALDLAQFTKAAIDAFGESVKPHIEEGFKAAQALFEKELGKSPAVIKERVKRNANEATKRQATVEAIKDKFDQGKRGDITNLVQKLARQLVEFGIKDRNELIDAVHGVLEQMDPTITRREAMDAISGYGDFKQLTKDEISVQLRDLKGQMQQVGKLEDMQSGRAPQKTGVERREPSDEERRLIQQVNEAKKKGGFTVTDPAKQLKSALDSIKTRLRNSIADLEHQIASGKRIVKNRTAPPTDAETDALRKQRDAIKQEFDDIFGKKELTDEQRIKAAAAALERSIAEYERQIQANDLFPKKQPSKTPNTPELEAMRSKRDALRAHVDELKSLDENFSQEKEDARFKAQQEAAARQVAELERRLEEGDLASRGQNQNRPAHPELEMFRQRRDELNRQIAEARKTPDGQKRAEAIQRQKETLEKQISELEAKIARGDTSAKNAPVNRPADPELEPLRQNRDELNRQLADMRKKPDAQKAAEAAQRQLDALNKQIAEREAKLKSGDLSSKPQKQNRPLSSPELEAAKQRLESVNKQIEDARKAARPKSTPEERANKAFRTRTLNRIDELQQRMANEDYSKKPRVPVKLNPENQKLQANKAEVVEAYRKSLLRDQLKNRTLGQKFLDTLVKWRRGFLLSSPVTLAKLTSAAAQRMTFTPVEEAVGKGIGSIFPRLAEKATRQGGLSLRAESKAITEGFTKGLADAWQTLKTGKSDLDRLYGRDDALPTSVVDFFGHLHGALKATTKRAEFARSFEKRVEAAAKTGVDVTDPMVQTRIALDAYKDAQKAIFQQDNRVVSAYKAALRRLENPDKATGKVPADAKAAAFLAKVFLPIVKVPTNIVAETMEYAVGSVTGSVNLAKAYRAGIEKLPPEQADLIMRQLKKGSLGAGLLLLGFFNPQVVGGYYQAGEKRKDSDVKAGSVNLYGHNIPSYLLHNPLLETLQIGATVRRVADSKLKKSDKEPQGISAGLMAGALGLTEEVPFVREMMEVFKAFDPHSRGAFLGELLKSTAVPQALQFAAQHYDTDAKGEQIKRKPATILQHIETGIPGLRETVPAKK